MYTRCLEALRYYSRRAHSDTTCDWGELLNFWDLRFAEDNGVRGKFPVLPSEWKAAGLDSDASCFKLLEYVYRTGTGITAR